jgi:predicted 2-oxoglutarate/Fe(II)-dependent dioxygenase YbiX
MNYPELFHNNGYLYLENFLDTSNCQQYVSEFKKLIDQGHTKKDVQCPLSHSLGHTALFDSLLEQLTPQMETATGKKLFPTYAYARWYAPGDELKIHRDRPSCEISATITLGFEGDPWAIWMGYDENKINCKSIPMKVGDAVVYQGEKLYHWREKYVEGQWQAQVFLHYVDANGPNKEWKFDKRKGLSHHSNSSPEKTFYFFSDTVINKDACNKLIQQFDNNMDQLHDATLTGNILNKNVRDTKKIQLPIYKSIGATMTGMGLFANKKLWNFDVTHANQSEFLRYDKNGHFAIHMDSNLDEWKTTEMRKLTCILFLNDDFEGGKLYFQCGKEKTYPQQNPGDFIVFPSFMMHGVEPIVSGIRRSIVTWLVGPYWK